MSPAKNITKNWHNINLEDVLDFFVVDKQQGLTDSEALERSRKLGRNEKSVFDEELSNIFTVKVVRNGKKQRVKSYNLVLGDIVHLEASDIVPADIRILEVDNCTVQQEAVTGVSAPAHKNSFTENLSPDNILSSKNMVFAGSTLLTGSLTGIVVSIGPNTEPAKQPKKNKKPSFTTRRKIHKLKEKGVIVIKCSALSGVSSVDTVILNVPLGFEGAKEAIRILSTGLGKNIIIVTDTENYAKWSNTVPGILKIDIQSFRQKSNKALLESDHPILALTNVSQKEILRYVNLLHIKNRQVLWIDSGKEQPSLFVGAAISVVLADTAKQASLSQADIILQSFSDNIKGIRQLEALLKT